MKSKYRHFFLALVLSVALFGLFLLSKEEEPEEVSAQSDIPWPMAGANPQRTSWIESGGAGGELHIKWIRPFMPYISHKIQPIAADGKVFVSTTKGLYAFNANDGSEVWSEPYATDLPLGHSPTYHNGVVYVGGLDRKLHAIDAATGQALWTFEGEVGFYVNPLVVENKVIIGDRAGNLYAVGAEGTPNQGQQIWKQTLGDFKFQAPILYSPAYKNGVVYVTPNNGYAYAINATDGGQIWKSQIQFHTAGFQSYWPVIYDQWLVIAFKGGARSTIPGDLARDAPEPEYLYTNTAGFNHKFYGEGVEEGYFGIQGSQPGPWAAGMPTLDVRQPQFTPFPGNAQSVPDYFEVTTQDGAHLRRHAIFLKLADGTEETFDIDLDGATDAAPIFVQGRHGGVPPPLVNGFDNIFYMVNVFKRHGSTSINGSGITGWYPLNPTLRPFVSAPFSHMSGGHGFFPGDEPVGISSAGNYIFWQMIDNRFMGSLDLSQANTSFPNVTSGRQWRYTDIGTGIAANYGYDYLYKSFQYTNHYCTTINPNSTMGDCQFYNHFDAPGPTPYNGMVFATDRQALIALAPVGNPSPTLPVVQNPTSNPAAPSSRSPADVKALLEAEIQKILTAGHLRPGFWTTERADKLDQFETDESDYFSNPADTITTLIRALPHLSSNLQNQLKVYLQSEFANYSPAQYAHIGWATGAKREALNVADVTEREFLNYPKNTNGITFSTAWKFPPQNWYALFKYAEVGLGDSQTIFENANNTQTIKITLTSIPDAADPNTQQFLSHNPQIHNAWITGLIGYLKLEALAGQPPSTAIQQKLDALLALRASNFTWGIYGWDLASEPGIADKWFNNYHNWNYRHLTPEMAAHMRQNALTKVEEAVNRSEFMAPYWFVAKSEETQGEWGHLSPYNYHGLFQAKAMILQQPFEELAKHIDVPAFAVGDLYYVDNLVSILEASGGQTPTEGDANNDGRVDGIDYVIWLNHYNQPTGNGAGDGDFNGDGVVDGVDYVLWLGNYNL